MTNRTPVYEVVSGCWLGELISAAYAHLIEKSRREAIEIAEAYHHRPAGFYTVPFASVYSKDKATADGARGQIYWNPAILPEMALSHYRFERAEQYNEISIAEEGIHSLNGMVLFRGIGNKPRRIHLTVVYHVASNGNLYNREVRVTSDNEEMLVIA